MGFSTDAVHGGQSPEETTGAVMPPIFQTSTYQQQGIGEHKGYEYGRTQNPTREALERSVAVLERGKHGIAYASGLAATQAIMNRLKAGDEVVISENVYGGTYRMAATVFTKLGLDFKFIDTTSLDTVAAAVSDRTRLVFIETPTNPMLRVTDIAAVAEIAKKHGVPLAVDNTFMSPYFQNPLELGASMVMHSTTKFLNGHSDMIGGIVVTSDEGIASELRYLQNATGAVPGPMDCWLALRGVKTLPLRMRQTESNAGQLARFLSEHKTVKKLYYPGMKDHPEHAVQKKQARGFGGLISIDVGDDDHLKQIVKRFKVFTLAESLGGIESLVNHPASMTHASVPKEDRIRMGLTDSLLRLSIGIEDVEDLQADLDYALS